MRCQRGHRAIKVLWQWRLRWARCRDCTRKIRGGFWKSWGSQACNRGPIRSHSAPRRWQVRATGGARRGCWGSPWRRATRAARASRRGARWPAGAPSTWSSWATHCALPSRLWRWPLVARMRSASSQWHIARRGSGAPRSGRWSDLRAARRRAWRRPSPACSSKEPAAGSRATCLRPSAYSRRCRSSLPNKRAEYRKNVTIRAYGSYAQAKRCSFPQITICTYAKCSMRSDHDHMVHSNIRAHTMLYCNSVTQSKQWAMNCEYGKEDNWTSVLVILWRGLSRDPETDIVRSLNLLSHVRHGIRTKE